MIFENKIIRRIYPFVYFVVALVLPLMLISDFVRQTRTGVLDFDLDWQTGEVLQVPVDSYANTSGFRPGDILLSLNNVPLNSWRLQSPGVMAAEVSRAGQLYHLELIALSQARQNSFRLITTALVVIFIWSVSIFLIVRKPAQSQARLLFFHGQVLACTMVYPLAYPSPWEHPPGLLPLSMAGFYFLAPLTLHLHLTFPIKLGSPSQRRLWIPLLYALAFLSITTWLWGSYLLRRAGEIYVILVFTASVLVLVYAYFRKASALERRRLRLIWFGTFLGIVPTNLFYFIPGLYGWYFQIPVWLVGVLLCLVPFSYLYAITRQNLFQIDRLINRAVVYGLLTAGVLAVYALLYSAAAYILPQESILQNLVSALLIVIISFSFERTRQFVQHWVDRLFYGGWYDYPRVVEAISTALANRLERTHLQETLNRSTAELMQLLPGELITHAGKAPGEGQFSYRFQADPNSVWVIGPHKDGDVLSEEDFHILNTLARQAEIALANVMLVEKLQKQIDEIQYSRQALQEAQYRLLRSREEERKRLARDLHDGPIQQLVSLNLQLGLMSSDKNNANIRSALVEIRSQVQVLLADLRQVCTDLRPPMLDTLGLGAALMALVEEWSQSNPVEVRYTQVTDFVWRELPEEIALNLYRAAQEALTNISRHANASMVSVGLAAQDGLIELNINDNGCGFNVSESGNALVSQNHFGLAGMQERMALIGGKLQVVSAAGDGTQINISCPL